MKTLRSIIQLRVNFRFLVNTKIYQSSRHKGFIYFIAINIKEKRKIDLFFGAFEDEILHFDIIFRKTGETKSIMTTKPNAYLNSLSI